MSDKSQRRAANERAYWEQQEAEERARAVQQREHRERYSDVVAKLESLGLDPVELKEFLAGVE